MIGEYAFPIAAIILLVIMNGLFVAAEFALVGARLSRLRAIADDGSDAAKWLVDVFERHAGKDSYIAVAQLGITLASIGLGMYGEPAVAHWLYKPLEGLGFSESASHTAGFIVALSAITFLHVVLGEMIPKALALQAPEAVSVRLNPIMRVFSTLFRPMVAVLNSIAFALMRSLRIPEPDKQLSLHTSDELSIVTDESAHSGQLGQLQRDLIRNIFDLDDRLAEEIMISRSNIEAIDVSAAAQDVAALISSSQRSRYPVIDGDLDHVVGMLHIKDFIRANRLGSLSSLRDITRPLPVVAATTPAEDLLEQFKLGNTHAAMVIDEFGTTVGFVSLDDVIAEIMEDETQDLIVRHSDGSMTVPGEAPLSDLRQVLDEPAFDYNGVVTIAGLLLAKSGEVPNVGDVVHHHEFELTVKRREGRKITQVGIRPPTASE
ncbi:MAG: CBS domain containing-hemolysin-like protein [Acidimicrobiales bacterium]|jgi:CBS domain containing-hemolysin-like protein